MTKADPKLLDRSRDVFVAVAGMSLQDLRDRVASQATGVARRDMLSALDTAARVFGRPLNSVRATPGAIRDLFGNSSGAQVGVSAKRLANIRSEIGKALRLYGESVPAMTKRIALRPEWSDLLDAIVVKHHRMGLTRFACFCSAMDIEPRSVGPDALVAFHAALEAEEVVKHPRKLLKLTIALWNMCGRRVPRWPDIVLSSPFKSQPYTLPLSAFPQCFQDDVETWAARLRDPDPLDPAAPTRALRPSTLKGQIIEIRRFASALVHRHAVPVEQLTGLRVFFEEDHFKSGLRFFLERTGNKPTGTIQSLANAMRFIAKHYCKVDPAVEKELAAICARLDPGVPRQMAARNRERLQQFDDPAKVSRLLSFPAEERARGARLRNPVRAARCMERALAIDLLISCVLRIQNLRTIHLTGNLRLAGGKHLLSFEADEVKNGQLLEFELSAEVGTALKEFCATYRPHLPGAEGPYLFPGEDGGPRSHNAMRFAIGETLRKNAGLVMHPHLFRHVIAKIVVERNPDMYVPVSRHLGHKRLDMTMAHYLGTETRAAARHIDRLLRDAREPGGKTS
jgi:integrase